MLNKLYKHNLHPRPIEIFTYKSISGIKIVRADSCPKNRYDNRHNEINFNYLSEIFGNHDYYLINHIGQHNYGLVDNKIMPIDYDKEQFAYYLKYNNMTLELMYNSISLLESEQSIVDGIAARTDWN